MDGEDDGAGDADGGDVDRGDGTLLGFCEVDGEVDGEIDRLMIPTIGVTRREEGATDGGIIATIEASDFRLGSITILILMLEFNIVEFVFLPGLDG